MVFFTSLQADPAFRKNAAHCQMEADFIDEMSFFDQPIGVMIDDEEIIVQNVRIAQALGGEVRLYIAVEKGFPIQKHLSCQTPVQCF
jgi:hypothetical protein